MEEYRKPKGPTGSGFNPSELEERILAFWEEHKIFEKSLEQTKGGKPFTFYDGPPFATGLPHYGHILASTIKDLIPRYQTMKGRFVRRRWGWDCHGLPIEEIVERTLGISGKKQIEEIGIQKFNETCRSKVLEYAEEWGKMVRRIARWIDFDNSYKTMDRDYMESVWWAFKQIYDKGLVYEGRKVLLYCPRCETPISNFEVAMDQSYELVKEEAVTVKFLISKSEFLNRLSTKGGSASGGKIPNDEPVYFLSWTTTPWTLPGNVALAVGKDIKYAVVKKGRENYIVAEELLDAVIPGPGSSAGQALTRNPQPGSRLAGRDDMDGETGMTTVMGSDLVGLAYEPLFDLTQIFADSTRTYADKMYRVYPADFVNTKEGTGIVHTAVVYGEEDYELGVKVGLPVVPLLDEKGKFNEKAPKLIRGVYFKDSEAIIMDDLAKRGLLFARAMHEHSYPHCWRCDTTLFYNAIPAWFINISKIKNQILKSNEKEINWFPAHLKHGRYEKSVEQAPDWNISRNRYWGNPIPIWRCEKCGKDTVVGSVRELGLERNTFYFSRHSESEKNLFTVANCYPEPRVFGLTDLGIKQAQEAAAKLAAAGGIDLIYTSDITRARRTAEVIGGILKAPVEIDERLREYNVGIFNGKDDQEFLEAFPAARRWNEAPEGGETWTDVQNRMVECVRDINAKQQGKKILLVSHGDPLRLLDWHFGSEREYPAYGVPYTMNVGIADLHRPYIDDVVLKCSSCGGTARRIKEIFDSWVEAGSMPFAEYHYPFEQKEVFESRYPAQFVAEYIAQTRAWFYVMHVIGLNLFGKAPFENVVTTGTILAEDGSKMSKSRNNFPDPWEVIGRYGVDSLRFYLMTSAVMQADNLNFSVRDLEGVHRKVTLILWNVFRYYRTYADQRGLHADGRGNFQRESASSQRKSALDLWIETRTQELVNGVTEHLDAYDTVRATRAIAGYIDDLSTWYLRRSRGREDAAFFATLRSALLTTSQVIAPVMPYLAELLHQELGRGHTRPPAGRAGTTRGQSRNDQHGSASSPRQSALAESVHLAAWPTSRALSAEEGALLRDMAVVREAASIGLAARKELQIPVRQPLALMKLKGEGGKRIANGELLQILKDEVNVKEIVFDSKITNEAELDAAITPELKLEGLARGLERLVQEFRKKSGLAPGELVTLRYATDDADLKRALELFNKKRTYVAALKEGGEISETCELEGKKIGFSVVKS